MLDTDAIGIAPVMGEWRPASDFLTLGHVPNTHVGKTLAWQGDHVVLHKRFSLHQVTTFRFIEQPIDGITDLGNNLQSIAEHGQDFFLLRDKLKPGTPLPCSRESIHFDDVGHRWMVVDIDGWAPPAHLSIRTPTHLHEIVDQAILTLLPPAFAHAKCWWQLSAGCGVEAQTDLRCHLAFWLHDKATSLDLRTWAKVHNHDMRSLGIAAQAVDDRLYQRVQIHYLANPIVSPDHLPLRCGWRQGEQDEVHLAEAIANAHRRIAEISANPKVKGSKPSSAPTIAAGGHGMVATTIDQCLAKLGYSLDTTLGLAGFHAPLRDAAFCFARDEAKGLEVEDDTNFLERCQEATKQAPRPVTRNIGEYVDTTDKLASYLASARKRVKTIAKSPAKPLAIPMDEPAATITLDEAQILIDCVVGDYLNELVQDRWQGGHLPLAASTGSGKSHLIGGIAEDTSLALKEQERDHKALWLVPTSKLAHDAFHEHFRDAQQKGLNVVVWRGRSATVSPSDDTPMCRNLEAVSAARKIGESAEITACGSEGRNATHQCPYYQGCPYREQISAAKQADIILAPYHVAMKLPAAIAEGLAFSVVDEKFWPSMVETSHDIPIDRLEQKLLVLSNGQRDQHATTGLREMRTKLATALRGKPDGAVAGKWFEAMTADDCRVAEEWEQARRVPKVLSAGMTDKERKAALQGWDAQANSTIEAHRALWQELAFLLDHDIDTSGRISLKDGKLVVRPLTSFDAQILSKPLIAMDAALPFDVVKRILPDLRPLSPIQVTAPFQQNHLVTCSTSMSAMDPDHAFVRRDPKKVAAAKNKITHLRDFVTRTKGDEKALLVTYKSTESHFTDIPGLAVAHFNNVAGRNDWKDVRHLFVAGRVLPPADAIADIAGVLTGHYVKDKTFAERWVDVPTTDGRAQAICCEGFSDAMMEAVRVAISDAEILQAMGRARGVRRGDSNPVDVWLLGVAVLPMQIDSVQPLERTCPWARMMDKGEVYESPAEAARAYPDLFASEEAAKKALKRAGPYVPPAGWTHLDYKLPGAGQKPRRKWVPKA